MPKLVVCITGMPGSGKTTVTKALGALRFGTVSMGDAVRAEAERRGLSLDGPTMNKLMVSLRDEMGPDAIAKLCLPLLTSMKRDYIAVDGVRSMEEVETFKSIGTVKLLAIHAPQEERYLRLEKRRRRDAPDTISEFIRRDQKELRVGVGRTMALADFIIMNSGIDMDNLERVARKAVSLWVKEVERD